MRHTTTMDTDKDRFVTPTVSMQGGHGFNKFSGHDVVGVMIPTLDDASIVKLQVSPRAHRFNYPAINENYPADSYSAQDILIEFDMDDADGTTVTDEAQGLVLTEQGDPTYQVSATTAGLGNGITFDGTDDALDFTLSTAAIAAGYNLPTTGDFSVEVVFKTSDATSGAGDTLVCCRDGAAGIGWQLHFDDADHLDFHIDDTTQVELTGDTDVDDGTTHHVLVTLDRDGNGVIYIDGAADDTTAISTAPGTLINVSADTRFAIGGDAAQTAGDCFTGTIYFVRVYNRVLTAAEALENYRILMNQGYPGWVPLLDPADGDDLVICKSGSDPGYFDLTEYMTLKRMAFRAHCATEQTTTPVDLDFVWMFE